MRNLSLRLNLLYCVCTPDSADCIVSGDIGQGGWGLSVSSETFVPKVAKHSLCNHTNTVLGNPFIGGLHAASCCLIGFACLQAVCYVECN